MAFSEPYLSSRTGRRHLEQTASQARILSANVADDRPDCLDLVWPVTIMPIAGTPLGVMIAELEISAA